jgi:type IV secretion system protein VirB1
MEVMNCQALAVPSAVMQHVVNVESSFNPFAIGVVGAKLVRQPRNLPEAVATARMLEARGYNFSLGLAQVNRHNLDRYGLHSYAQAFGACANLQAGARILAGCLARARNDWGRAFSCYYSGNFCTGFRAGYVGKVMSLWRRADARAPAAVPSRTIAIDTASAMTARASAPQPTSVRLDRDTGQPGGGGGADPASAGGPATTLVAPVDAAFVF